MLSASKTVVGVGQPTWVVMAVAWLMASAKGGCMQEEEKCGAGCMHGASMEHKMGTAMPIPYVANIGWVGMDKHGPVLRE